MKKIAIIGGGFYGCYLSSKLSEKYNVTLFEKNKQLLKEAISNNQHRLHLGFHYPRSVKTINQTVDCFNDFKFEFNDCCISPENNFYFISNNSKVSFSRFCSSFNSENYDLVDYKLFPFVKNYNNLTGCISTKEEIIDLTKLKNKIKSKLENVKVICDFKVNEKNLLKLKEEYDFVINTTYYMPNLGIKTNRLFKYQLCLIPVVKLKKYIPPVTVMDGDFVSIYPTENNLEHTLSSVIHTPIMTSENINEVLRAKEKINYDLYCNNIIKHCKSFFNFKIESIIKYYKAIKCKPLFDNNDTRESFIISDKNYFSIYCGKISAVIQIYKKLDKLLCQTH